MKISDVICTALLLLFCLSVSVLVMIIGFGIITAICAIPVYIFCMIFGTVFKWSFAAILAGILFVVYVIKTM